MKYRYQLYELGSGHVIVTPEGKPMTEDELHHYFSIVDAWLKDVRPKAHEAIRPDADVVKTRHSMLSKMFDAFLYDPEQGGVKDRHCFDERTLAFIFVVSYAIQEMDTAGLTPFLLHTMGNALLEWLPIPELVEHYLSLSAEMGKGSEIKDALTLTNLFCPGVTLALPCFEKDPRKALKYARMMSDNPFNDHGINRYDYVYAWVLYLNGSPYEAECMRIVTEKLDMVEADEERMANLLDYLALGLEACATAEGLEHRLDLNRAEQLLERGREHYPLLADSCAYWLAKCHIAAWNDEPNPTRAKALLLSIRNPSLKKKVGAALAQLALDSGDDEEAWTILRTVQYLYGPLTDDDREIAEVMDRVVAVGENGDGNSRLRIGFRGKYGESFAVTEIEEGKYTVTCREIGMDPAVCTQTELDELFRAYALEGRPDFDPIGNDTLMARAVNMGNRLRELYGQLNGISPFERLFASTGISDVLRNAEVLSLNDTQYVDWFLSHGATESDEYIRFMLRAKRWIVKR